MAFRVHFRPQQDGSTYQNVNCDPTSHGMACERACEGVNPRKTTAPWLPARGKLPSMASAIRKRIIALFGVTGGTHHYHNQAAVKSLYGVETEVIYGCPWQDFVNGVRSGRGAVVSIVYKLLHGTPYDACPGFDGRHAVWVNEIRWNSTRGRWEALVYDPLADGSPDWVPQGPQWWALTRLKKAMIATHPGEEKCDVAFTRNTEIVVRTTKLGPSRLRKGPRTSFDTLTASVPAGTKMLTVARVSGSSWTVGDRSGSTWFKVAEINGVDVKEKYGVDFAYLATGWF
jgi:hypothetical protein